jgi:hypothetical protein
LNRTQSIQRLSEDSLEFPLQPIYRLDYPTSEQPKKQNSESKPITKFNQPSTKKGKSKHKNRQSINQKNKATEKTRKQHKPKEYKNPSFNSEITNRNTSVQAIDSALDQSVPTADTLNTLDTSDTSDTSDTLDTLTALIPSNDTARLEPIEQNAPLPFPQGYSVGGEVITSDSPKPIAASDTVPAMLTPGEFVVNATDAQKHLPLLQHINQGGRLEIAPIEVQNTEDAYSTENRHVADYSKLKNRSLTPAPADSQHPQAFSHLPLSPKLPVHKHLAFAQVKPLQSGAFAEDYSTSEQQTQPHPASMPIFQARRSIHSLSNSSSHTSANTSPSTFDHVSVGWNSVEELLQIDSDQSLPFVTNPQAVNEEAIPTRSTPTFSIPAVKGFAERGQVTDSVPGAETQPVTETIGRSSDEDASNSVQSALEALAQEIYSRLQQRLEIERERQGGYSGRLPW